MSGSPADQQDVDEQELLERRRLRRKRMDRAAKRGARKQSFMANPLVAVFAMIIALASIVAYWGGMPSWVLLALGFGAVLILVIAAFFWKARRK